MTVYMVMRSHGFPDRYATTTVGLPSLEHGIIGGHLSPEGMSMLSPVLSLLTSLAPSPVCCSGVCACCYAGKDLCYVNHLRCVSLVSVYL